jgi:hypothetical protein
MSGNGARCANHQVKRRLRKGHAPNSVFILSIFSVFSIIALSVFALSVYALSDFAPADFSLSVFALDGDGAASTSY